MNQAIRMLEGVDRLYNVRTVSDFAPAAVRLVQQIFPTAFVAYHDVPLSNPIASQHWCKDFETKPALIKAWNRLALQSPVVQYYLRGGTNPVVATQDLISDLQLRNSELYNECWRPFGVTHQIGIRIWNATRIQGLSIKRDGRFSDLDHNLVQAIHPHFLRCFESVAHDDNSRLEYKQSTLTSRENEVLEWVCEGKRDGEIGVILGISCRTAEKHVAAILKKLGVETRGAAANVCRFRAIRPEVCAAGG